MSEEEGQVGLRKLVACILERKLPQNVAAVVACFLSYRCMICDEGPGVFIKVFNICEWRCMTCSLALLPDDTWGHRSIHNHSGSSPASGLSEGVSSSASGALSEVLAQSSASGVVNMQCVSSSESSALSEVSSALGEVSSELSALHHSIERMKQKRMPNLMQYLMILWHRLAHEASIATQPTYQPLAHEYLNEMD